VNVRKLNAHRARLSFEKPTGWVRKTNKRGKSVLVSWNMKGRGHHSRLYPHQEHWLHSLRSLERRVMLFYGRRTGMSSTFAMPYSAPATRLWIDPRKDAL
jgi:hypothetical protein